MNVRELPLIVADPYPPYQYLDKGRVVGLDHDIVVNAFKIVGVDVKIELHPWDKCIEMLDNGVADAIFQMVKTPEREKKYLFSDPIRKASTVLYKSKVSNFRLHPGSKIEDRLKGFRLGLVKGYSYGPLIDGLKGVIRIEVKDQEELLKGLMERSFDLALIDRGVSIYLMDELGFKEGLEEVEGFAIIRELYLALRKDEEPLLNLFNEGLKRIKLDGLYERIFRHYGVQP
ncbi:MAG: transporter substrate-binding domain-containing protein [Candidatus Bathyarchaeia archaeon]|nr:amino acid ABC transporter substrate-binding protein [Candidatus Bathyarchaeota archaeon]